MSRLHTAASSEYFTLASGLVTAAPLSMVCWFRSDDADALQALMGVGDSASNTHLFSLELAGATAGDPVRIFTRAGGGANIVVTSTGYSINTWHHAAMVQVTTTDRSVFIDGGSEGNNTTSVIPAGVNLTRIGSRATLSVGVFMSGRIAEAAIYDAALTNSQVAMLARGVSPFRVLPGNLVGYYSLPAFTGNAIDYSGNGNNLTDTNTVGIADHAPVPPMFGMGKGWRGAFTEAAAAAVGNVGQRYWQHERHYPRGVNHGVLRGAIR